MKYPQAFIEKLKENAVLSEIIQKYVPLKRKGHEFQACCPFHKEKTPSFTVNNEKSFYHCFGCGAHGTVFDFIMYMENINFPEAIKYVADLQGVPLPQVEETPEDKEKQSQESKLLKLNEEACRFFEKNLHSAKHKSAQDYLESRGLKRQTIQTFRLGYASDDFQTLRTYLHEKGYTDKELKLAGLISVPDDTSKNPYDKFRNRIIFPIFNKKGQVIAFGGRILGQGEPKYLNSPETPLFHKGYVLYGFNFAIKSRQRETPPVVVEGYMDTIILYQYGYDKVVAPLGTALTENHLNLLWRLHNNPILCFDGDAAGIRAAYRSAEKALPYLKAGNSLKFLSLPKGHDPDSYVQEYGLETFKKQFGSATPLSELIWNILIEETNPTTPENVALLKKKIFETCQRINDSTINTYYKRYLMQSLSSIEKSLSFKSKVSSPQKTVPSSSIQQRILLATFLAFPKLVEEFEEAFATLTFSSNALEALQQEILNYYHAKKILEKQELETYLIKEGHSKVGNVLNLKDLFIHAPYLANDDINTARENWQHIYNNYINNNNKKEQRNAAKEMLSGDFSRETWERFKNLKKLK
jgi:DNA primase